MNEELAIINGGSYGCRDAGRPILWFGVKMLTGGGALIVMEEKEANKFIRDNDIHDVKDLNDKACVVETSGMRVTFKCLLK